MKKKKILVNGRFSSHHFAIRNVILNIVKQIAKMNEYDLYVVVNKDSDYSEIKGMKVNIIINPIRADSAILNHLYTMFILPWILLIKGISIVIYPQICFYLCNPFCKVILYMHDLIEYHLDNQKKSKLVFRKYAYPYICHHADRIITVSECTKNDVVNILGINPNKIYVAFDGKDEGLKPIPKDVARKYVKNKYNIENYIFYIGYLTHPQKNLIYLIDEFVSFKKKHPLVNLVFAGPKGNKANDILTHANEVIPNGAFSYIGKVPYEDLKYLYSACSIFCFPSLFEGFGMPVLEAMACGSVVIASNRSSIPEILSDYDFLIDPEKEGCLANLLDKYYFKDNLVTEKRNVERAKLFTWEKHGLVLRNIIINI